MSTLLRSRGKTDVDGTTLGVTYFNNKEQFEEERTRGQFYLQTVASYTNPLVLAGYGCDLEAAHEFEKSSWNLGFAEKFKAKFFKALSSLGGRSKLGHWFLTQELYYDVNKPPSVNLTCVVNSLLCRCCSNGTPIEGHWAEYLAGKLIAMLEKKNVGMKTAYLLDWFSQVFAPLDITDFYDEATFWRVDALKDGLLPQLLRIIELLLTTDDRVYMAPAFSNTFHQLQNQHYSSGSRATPKELGMAMLHALTVSFFDRDVVNGVDSERCYEIARFNDGALLKLVWSSFQNQSKFSVREDSGAPTRGNIHRVMSNLILSGEISEFILEDDFRDWTDALLDMKVDLIFNNLSSLKGTAYGNEAIALEALCIEFCLLLECSPKGFEKIVGNTEHMKKIIEFFDQTPDIVNSVITLLDGLVTHMSFNADALKTMRYARIPSKLLGFIQDNSNNPEARVFQAVSALGKLIGNVPDHPFLSTAGELMFRKIQTTLKQSTKYYSDPSAWRAELHLTQGVFLSPHRTLQCVVALLNTKNNRLSFAEYGLIHDVANVLDIMKKLDEKQKLSVSEQTRMLQEKCALPSTTAGRIPGQIEIDTTKRTILDLKGGISRAGNVVMLPDVLQALRALRLFAFDIIIAEDLEKGFETEGINIVELCQYFFKTYKPLKRKLVGKNNDIVTIDQDLEDVRELARDLDYEIATEAEKIERLKIKNQILAEKKAGEANNDIFISYCWKTGFKNEDFTGTPKIATFFNTQFQGNNYSTFYDRDDMEASGGLTATDRMVAQINSVKKAVVLLIDSHYVTRPNCLTEFDTALARFSKKRDIAVYPIFIGGQTCSGLPQAMNSKLRASDVIFFQNITKDEATKQFMKTVGGPPPEKLQELVEAILGNLKNNDYMPELADVRRFDNKMDQNPMFEASAASAAPVMDESTRKKIDECVFEVGSHKIQIQALTGRVSKLEGLLSDLTNKYSELVQQMDSTKKKTAAKAAIEDRGFDDAPAEGHTNSDISAADAKPDADTNRNTELNAADFGFDS